MSPGKSKLPATASRERFLPPKGELSHFFGHPNFYRIGSSKGGKYELKKILEAQRDEKARKKQGRSRRRKENKRQGPTIRRHNSGWGGGWGGRNSRRPQTAKQAKQPHGTAATRVNAQQDTRSREMHSPGGGGQNCRQARDTKKQRGGQKKTSGRAGWGGVGGGGTAAGCDKHQRKARKRTHKSEQGNTSGRPTTTAKQKHGVAHRTRSGGQPV